MERVKQIDICGGRSMGLFDKLKPNKNNKDFFEWLDLILKNELNEKSNPPAMLGRME